MLQNYFIFYLFYPEEQLGLIANTVFIVKSHCILMFIYLFVRTRLFNQTSIFRRLASCDGIVCINKKISLKIPRTAESY